MHNIPPDLVIRKVQKGDVVILSHLAVQLGYVVCLDELTFRIDGVLRDKDHIILVATVEDDKIVGWIHAYVCKTLIVDQYVEIGGLIVEDSYRKRGIGRELMACMDKWAIDQNCMSIRLRSNAIRENAHLFYENLGFTNQKTQFTYAKSLVNSRTSDP